MEVVCTNIDNNLLLGSGLGAPTYRLAAELSGAQFENRIDYLMQCIGETVLLHVTSSEEPHSTTGIPPMIQQHLSSGGTVTFLNERTIKDALAEVVMGLKEHIPELIPFLQEEFLVTLYRIFSPSCVLEKIPGSVC
ncbi:hypothetical protein E2C01_058861 [Portunus trituberculatus]|uniref:Uncharacterized protein n=1 Tax=Portunus trituberculatus TaxID=210409 RepID=A0A5B7GWN5_PORTR|nr:hypothetical protein [Portunus trituberculatus]